MSLRKTAETEMGRILENPDEFGMPVIVTYPDGTVQSNLYGKIVYGWSEVQPQTQQIIVNEGPVVTLRISSMNQEIKNGDKAFFQIPTSPDPLGTKTGFILEHGRVEYSRSLGFVKFFLHEAKQKP